MPKTLRFLFVLISALVFVVGLLIGQQIGRSKFEKYLHPGTVAPMDLALLRVNLYMVRDHLSFEVPTVDYDSSCACFIGRATISSEVMKLPLDQVRGRLTAIATLARGDLAVEFPELSSPSTVPDRDFRMTFFELNLKNPVASVTVAEYANGKIVFK